MIDVTQSMACIQCGVCVSACLSLEVDPEFIGPAALAKAYRFVGDPRDGQTEERLRDLAEDPHGIYDCTHCFACIEVCPKDVAPMNQIMRLRRRATGDYGIKDAQQRLRPREGVRGHHREVGHAARGAAAAALLRRRLAGQGPGRAQRASSSCSRALPTAVRGLTSGKVTPQKALLHPKLPDQNKVQADLQGDRVERRAARAEPLHRRRERRRGGGRHGRREPGESVKLALLARLRLARLHPRAARLDGAGGPQARPRAGGARPRQLLRRRRDRRAQPGAGRHAQRAHLRDGAGRGRRRGHDEHLLHLPGRAVGVPGAPGRRRRLPRAHQHAPHATRASPTSATASWWNKNFLWLLVEEIGLDKLREKVVRPLEGLRIAPFYGCYIVRPTERLGLRRAPRARPVPGPC